MNMDNDDSVDFPNLGDYEVMEKLMGLRRVFKTHKRIMDKTSESYPFYPEELQFYLSEIDVYSLWDRSEYSTIEELYVGAWIEYIESVYIDRIYFTVNEFLDGTAEEILQDWFAV